MAITPVSKKAFVILAACEKTKKSFAITVDPQGRELKLVWAFKIDREKAQREHFDAQHVQGQITFDNNYPGCPYCHSNLVWICSCGTVVCWHGQMKATCPNCKWSGRLEYADSFSLSGGGL